MKQIILHIGMHKTGTTSIQQSLDGYRNHRIKYLDLGWKNHSIPIVTGFSDTPETYQIHMRVGRTADEVQELRKKVLEQFEHECAEPGFDKLVISGEDILSLRRKPLEQLKGRLQAHADDVRVFAYLRDPIGYASSAFQQRVRGGSPQAKLIPPKYRTSFEKFIDVFGADRVQAKRFAKSALLGGSVVADFCDHWKIPFDLEKEIRANESMSEPVVKLLLLFNREGVKSTGSQKLVGARRRMMAQLSEQFPGKFEVPAEFHSQVVDEEDLAWVREELGLELLAEKPAGPVLPAARFEEYMADIEPAVVDRYRELLERQKVKFLPGDGLIDLLNKHYQRTLASK